MALLALSLLALSCSPEARRGRDDGPGADVGNKDLVVTSEPEPHAADTTLWPGRAPAPVDRFARGEMPPPAGVSPLPAPPPTGQTPVTPNTPATTSEQHTFDRGTSANPRQRSSGKPEQGKPGQGKPE
ncbi:MAG: hypothetical protein ACJ79S_02450 [Gemmatimonadaceae bacterium]